MTEPADRRSAPVHAVVHAVVLAAGGSSRLGRPKQLVEVGGRSLLRRVVETAKAAGVASVTVVLGASADIMTAELAGLDVRIAHNPRWEAGMGSSIRCGVRALESWSDAAGVLFLLCDQLALTEAHLARMIAAFREDGATIVASGYAGTAGVPALFSSAFREELYEFGDKKGGKQLLERHARLVRVVPLPEGDLDLDTPDDLKRALIAARTTLEDARRDFPALDQRVHDRPLIYLDSASTALKPRAVIEAVTQVYARDSGNVHRGLHLLSQRASEAYEGARAAMKTFLGARSADEIVFVRGATEALNLVASSWAAPRLRPGDRILITALEHHANIVPWQIACERAGAELDVAPINAAGDVALDALFALLSPRTRLVAVAHVSNVLGTVLPVEDIARRAHACGALVAVDGAQAAPHLRVNVEELGCDFYALSGHKLYGPSGTGVLWARRDLLEAMPPYQVGGDMVASVTFEKAVFRDPPHRFEAGTPNIEGVIGLGEAVRYLSRFDPQALYAHERDLLEYAAHALEGVPGLRLLGSPARRVAVLSFWLEGVHPHDLSTFLDSEGIAVRAGHHCAEPLLNRLDYPALTRVSFGVYNTRDDIDALLSALHKACAFFSS